MMMMDGDDAKIFKISAARKFFYAAQKFVVL
jgi:hypothetical protein